MLHDIHDLHSDRCNLPPLLPQTFIQILPAGSVIDWVLPPGGPATWLRVTAGCVHIVAAMPTAENLAAYAAWCAVGRAAGRQLAGDLQGVKRFQASFRCSQLLEPSIAIWSLTGP